MENEAIKPGETQIEQAIDESRRPMPETFESSAESNNNEARCCNGVCQVVWKPQRSAA